MTSLLERVRAALGADVRIRNGAVVRELKLEPDNVLSICADVQSLAIKKRVLGAAARAAGEDIKGVADRILVVPSMEATDIEIGDGLKRVLARDLAFADIAILEDLDPSPLAERLETIVAPADARGRIEIEVRDGVITLNGAVPSLARKRLAGAMAWWRPGVRDVVNGLAVEPPEQDSPDDLEEAVRLVLEHNPLIEASQIRVGVRGGVVRLTGLVRTVDVSRLAEADAWSVLGVDEVLNEIEVRA